MATPVWIQQRNSALNRETHFSWEMSRHTVNPTVQGFPILSRLPLMVDATPILLSPPVYRQDPFESNPHKSAETTENSGTKQSRCLSVPLPGAVDAVDAGHSSLSYLMAGTISRPACKSPRWSTTSTSKLGEAPTTPIVDRPIAR
jgi:hypothetical protein